MTSAITRRTALIGGTGVLAGTMFFAGNTVARQATPPDGTTTVDAMDVSRIVTAAQEALAIVEADRAAIPSTPDDDLIDTLLLRGGEVIAAALSAATPRREAVAGVTLLAAAQVLLLAPPDSSLPSRAGITSRTLSAAADAIDRFIGDGAAQDPNLSTWSTDLYARAYASNDVGSFGLAARQAQAAALVAGAFHILASGNDDLADFDTDVPGEHDGGWRRLFRQHRNDRHLALAAPVVNLLRPVEVVDIPAPERSLQ